RRVNFLDRSVSHFLYVVLRTTVIIFTDLFFFQQGFYFIVRITTHVTHGNATLLSFTTHHFDEIFTTLFGQRRQRNADVSTRRAWVQTQVRRHDRFFNGRAHGAIEYVDFQRAGIFDSHARQLTQRCWRTVVFHDDAIQQAWRSTAS